MNSPLFEVGKIRLLNVPHAQSLAEEVITEDCYELAHLNRDWFLIDCGACYGEASLYAASLGAYAYALEPSDPSFAVLTSNVEINRDLPGMVIPCNRFVGVHNAIVEHYFWPHHPGGSGKSPCDKSIYRQMTAIGVDRLIKDALHKYGKHRKIAVKMDIEGSEVEAFKDCDEWLPKVEHIALETHNFDNDVFAAHLERNGFEVKLSGTGKPPRVAWDKSMAGGLVVGRRKAQVQP